MSRILIAAAMLALVEPAVARDYTQEIERAMRSCKVESSSLLRDRRGTPSCDEIERLIDLQRLNVEAEVALETGQPMPGREAGSAHSATRHSGGHYVQSPRLSPRRVFDPVIGRWCWIFANGATMKCE